MASSALKSKAAPVVHEAMWQLRNAPRRLPSGTSDVDLELLDELRLRGIAVRPFDAVFRQTELLDRLRVLAADPELQRQSPSKDFLQRLMPEQIDASSPYIALALEPQVVGLANAYLGLRSFLIALDVWRNVPTDEPAKLSQLWHQDRDDRITLKLFVYLSDVSDRHGPFSYATGTQPGGPNPLPPDTPRLDDDGMARHVPREDWVVATGPAGTVVIADTCGWHKGGKPLEGDRLLWTAQFTSGAPWATRNFQLDATALPADLSANQRYALFQRPLTRR